MSKILIVLIKLYRMSLRPYLPMTCRFVPSCSEYSLTALKKYGALKGTYLTITRLLRCHPWSPGGFDPVS